MAREESEGMENPEDAGAISQDTIRVVTQSSGTKLRVFEISLLKDSLGKLMLEGPTPLVFPKSLLEDMNAYS